MADMKKPGPKNVPVARPIVSVKSPTPKPRTQWPCCATEYQDHLKTNWIKKIQNG